MPDRLVGRIESGAGDASRWLTRFNAAYARKLGIPVFPGSLNLRLDAPFDWTDPRHAPSVIEFGRDEYGGERDILLLPCRLGTPDQRAVFLWRTTTPREGAERSLVELVTDISIRDRYGLVDGDLLEVEILHA